MTTIRDVAKECGVSTATVSNVLNNTGRPVHPETRSRILDAIERLNYHPNAIARGLTGQRLQAIGVLFGVVEPEVVTNPYANVILSGILSIATERQYNVTLWTMLWRNAIESARQFRDRRADGFIVVAPPLDSDIVFGLAGVGLPLTVISSQVVPDGVPFVDVDNELGLYLSTKHVIEQGHRRIAHMMGDIHQPSVEGRRNGFLRAMDEACLPVRREYMVSSRYIPGQSKESARKLLMLPDRPTAIVTGSDNIALDILEVAREMKIAVPEELSVTGFDDCPLATLVIPPLTTVRQPLKELGKIATTMVLDQIENGVTAEGITLAPELIVRDSTAPPAP